MELASWNTAVRTGDCVQRGTDALKHRAPSVPFTEAQLEAKKEGETKGRPRRKPSCCLQGVIVRLVFKGPTWRMDGNRERG